VVARAKKKMIFPSLVFLVAILFSNAWDEWQVQSQQRIIIYNISKHTAIDFVEGHRYYSILDTSLQNNSILQKFGTQTRKNSITFESAGSSIEWAIHKR
jgi:competence protein ComEC